MTPEYCYARVYSRALRTLLSRLDFGPESAVELLNTPGWQKQLRHEAAEMLEQSRGAKPKPPSLKKQSGRKRKPAVQSLGPILRALRDPAVTTDPLEGVSLDLAGFRLAGHGPEPEAEDDNPLWAAVHGGWDITAP